MKKHALEEEQRRTEVTLRWCTVPLDVQTLVSVGADQWLVGSGGRGRLSCCGRCPSLCRAGPVGMVVWWFGV